MGTFTLNMLSLAREGAAGMPYALNSLWLAATMQGGTALFTSGLPYTSYAIAFLADIDRFK
jgi:hypothetical protein